MTEEQKKIQVAKWVPYFYDLIQKNGINETVIPLLISQIILESGYFDSNAFKLDFNPGGITWSSRYLKRPGTSVGRPRPKSEKGNYVHFNSYDDAVKDYLRIITTQFSDNKIGKPIDATNYIDYATRLKANGYYGKHKLNTPGGQNELKNYIAGMKANITRNDNWVDWASLKKNSSLNMAGLNPVFILIVLSFFLFKK